MTLCDPSLAAGLFMEQVGHSRKLTIPVQKGGNVRLIDTQQPDSSGREGFGPGGGLRSERIERKRNHGHWTTVW